MIPVTTTTTLSQLSKTLATRFRFSGACAVAVFGFVAITLYLQQIDVFDQHRAVSGAVISWYNVCRVAFLFYFVWLTTGTGWIALALLRRFGFAFRLAELDHWLLAFFLGAAVLTIVMLLLGLLKLYYTATAVVLALVILITSYRHLASRMRRIVPAACSIVRSRDGWNSERVALVVLITSLVGLTAVLLLTRCLYPGEGRNDIYEIYWPYQRLVVASHGIWPNEIWYMFYIFKGAGLNFFAMLLTDDLAIQSVTFCMLLAAVVAVLSIVKRIGGSTVWALLAAVTALGAHAFSNPHWGAFQSHHIGAAMWLVCMSWMAVLTFTRDHVEYRGWFSVWLVLLAAEIIFFPLFVVFVLPTLLLLALGHALVRKPGAALGYFVLAAGGTVVLIAILLLNYAVGGMILQDPLRVAWQFADQARYSKWCSPYLPIYVLEGSALTTGGISLAGFLSHDTTFWSSLFRLETLGLLSLHWAVPVVLGMIALVTAVDRIPSHVRVSQIIPLLAPLIVAVAIVDSGHPQSVYRNYGFVCLLLPALLCLLWQNCFELVFRSAAVKPLTALFAVAVAFVCVSDVHRRGALQRGAYSPSRWPQFFGFATGKLSVREALIRGDGLWSVADLAKSTVSVNDKMYCFNAPTSGWGSALFPGSGLLTEPTASFGRDWHVVVFEDADRARKALQKQDINYFLMDLSAGVRGALAFSPLFDPAHVADRFDLVWMEGSASLWTWRGKGKEPLPEAVVHGWKSYLTAEPAQPGLTQNAMWAGLYQNVRIIYEANKGKGYPIERPPNLPRVPGWQ